MSNIFDLQATISLNAQGFETGIQQAQTAFSSFGSGISTGSIAVGTMVGNMATKAASGLVDLGKESLQTGMDFNAAMSNVGAISGATEDQLHDLREAAIEWGGSTKFSATEVAEAFSYMAMAGWGADQMLAGIGGVLNLAAASNESLATTSDIVTDALTAFGLSAEDTGRFVNALAAAATSSNTDVAMMGETFKYIAPLAGTLGYSVEDVATAIGTMANSSIKGSQAGTALRAALSKLFKPTDDMTEALNKLGLLEMADGAENFTADLTLLTDEMHAVDTKTESLAKAQDKYNAAVEKYGADSPQAVDALKKVDKATYELQKAEHKLQDGKDAQMRQQFEYNTLLKDSQGNMVSFAKTVDALRNAFAGLTAAEKAEYAAVLFGTEASSAMLTIINSTDAEYGALSDTIGGASEAYGGLGVAAEMAAKQQDNLAGDVTTFGSAFETLKIRIEEYMDAPLREAQQTATEAIRAITRGLTDGGLSGAFQSLGGMISDSITEKLHMLSESAGPVGEVIRSVAGSVGELAGAFQSAAGAGIEAVASGVQSLMSAFEEAGAGTAIKNVAESVKDYFSAYAGASADVISGIAGAVKEFLSGFDSAGGSGAIAKVATDAADLFAAFVGASGDAISAIGEGVRNFLDAFPSAEIGGIIGTAAEKASELFSAFATVASGTISDIAAAIKTFFDGFDNTSAGSIIQDLAGWIGELFGHFSEGFAAIVSRIGEAFSGFAQKLASLWNEAGPSMKDTGEAIHAFVENAKTAMQDFFAVVQPIAEWLASGLSVAVEYAIGALVREFGGLWNAITDIVAAIQEAFGGIVSLIHGDLSGAIEHFKAAWENVKEMFSHLGDALLAPFRSLKETLGNEANEGVRRLKEPFEKVISWFSDIGARIVEGLKSGISSAWGSLTSFLSDKVSSLTDGVKSIFGIHSPSRVFADIGKNLVLGLREGWDDNFGDLERAVMRDAKQLTAAVQVPFAESALGKSSSAQINSYLSTQEGRGDGVCQIVLKLDGDVAASALYDPIKNEEVRRDGVRKDVLAYA